MESSKINEFHLRRVVLAFWKAIQGVTAKHYFQYVSWYYQKEREEVFNPFRFAEMLGKITHEEFMKRMGNPDEYDPIHAPEV
ncbi:MULTISPECIES: hypothetical protein [unclassified Lysinibacillus]|uniref:hypothetical protein n=1 Tax=unclassified Lysinibacillus TaxID=2636778 RepID=UPI0038262060